MVHNRQYNCFSMGDNIGTKGTKPTKLRDLFSAKFGHMFYNTAVFHCVKAQNVVVCDIEPELKERLKKFRLRKETNNAAIISK